MSEDFDHVVIKLDEFGKGRVAINGHDLKSTHSISFEAFAGEPTTVVIRVFASVEADVLVGNTKRRQSIVFVHAPHEAEVA